MKLSIDRKWKWLAMDESGHWFGFSGGSPILSNSDLIWCDGFNGDHLSFNLFNLPKARNWKQSLHKRVGEQWVKVK